MQWICRVAPDDCAVALVCSHADRLVELAHIDGHPVWASMSKSAMRRVTTLSRWSRFTTAPRSYG